MFISSVPTLNQTGREPQSNAEQQHRTEPYESIQALMLICKALDQAACSADFTTSSNFRSFVSGSFNFADTSGTDSRKLRR